eukprot:TRINITY_DN2783_c0_g1_i5.p1 TRINITY_DN2783_c0_g1~~TRINITY_DN2783_c0_g1_i5.p1  ORF type:complete len:198 (-),score=15.52 TRINITY_DN2783_c0_g1_i5:154-747(-)
MSALEEESHNLPKPMNLHLLEGSLSHKTNREHRFKGAMHQAILNSHQNKIQSKQFIDSYRLLVENKVPRHYQYRIIYSFLSKYKHSSGGALAMLNKYLPNTLLKDTTTHLLEIMSLALSSTHDAGRESEAAGKVTERGRSCEPRMEKTSKAKRTLSKTQKVVGQFHNSNESSVCKPQFNKQINSFFVSKRGNYFNAC